MEYINHPSFLGTVIFILFNDLNERMNSII